MTLSDELVNSHVRHAKGIEPLFVVVFCFLS